MGHRVIFEALTYSTSQRRSLCQHSVLYEGKQNVVLICIDASQ